MLVSK